MNNEINAAKKDSAPKGQTDQADYKSVDSLTRGFVGLTIGLLSSMAEEYDHRKAVEKVNKQATCVQLIVDAIFEGRRLRKSDLMEIIPYLNQMNRREVAEKLEIPLDLYNAGVKRWYHLF